MNNKYKAVLFRELIGETPSTTYVTHTLYMYPAKFIPHVVRFVINKYTKPGDWLFDPFAGYGTVAIEASLTGRNAVLWDLNPIMGFLVNASTYQGNLRLGDFEINFNYDKPYKPTWENIHYWYPRDFLEALSRVWGYWHYEVLRMDRQLASVIAIPLLRLSRYFSYADLEIAKTYKSKEGEKRVRELLSTDWRQKMIKLYWDFARDTHRKILDYQSKGPKKVELIVRAGIDSLNTVLDREVDVLITSPPYLQSQEYIRSFKIELSWLDYGDKLTWLSKHEIPYNTPPNVRVLSKTYEKYRREVAKLDHSKLINLYDMYFKSLVHFLNKNHEMVKKVIAIFVGPAKIRGMRIPIDEILREHLEALGWKHEVTFIDTIVSRRLFRVERNPATGLPEERTPTEHLLIMTK